VNACNWILEAPAVACGEDERILGDFIGVSSLQHVDIFKLGLPPLIFFTYCIVFALFQVCEYSCGTGDGKKAEATHITILQRPHYVLSGWSHSVLETH
jgi:hypothetical protein